MRVPRIPLLLLIATCCLSGCCSFNGAVVTDHEWAVQKGGVIQKGGVSQKGTVSQKGAVVQKGHVYQKGHVGHVHQKGVVQKGVAQKGVAQKGVAQKGVIHQNLWNHFEPSACCDSWDPVLGSCNACGVCGGDCEGHTPAQHLKHTLTCASGCGEIYWGEWISDPPAACDPCDDWGNYVGPMDCGGPSCLDTLASGWCNLFGFRGGGGKGGKGHPSKGHVGCSTCRGKGSGCNDCGGTVAPEYYEVPSDDGTTEVVPTPEIEASHRGGPRPQVGGFSIRSARLTR